MGRVWVYNTYMVSQGAERTSGRYRDDLVRTSAGPRSPVETQRPMHRSNVANTSSAP